MQEQQWQVEAFWEGASPISSMARRLASAISPLAARVRIAVLSVRFIAHELRREATWKESVR